METKLCEYGCGLEAKHQLKNGRWCCEEFHAKCPENKRKNSERLKDAYLSGRKKTIIPKSWNKGLTKENNLSVRRISEKLKTKIASGELVPSFLNRKHKPSTRLLMSKKCGGIRHGSGRGKRGWYKGFWCDSSWELAWVIYNLDHGIKFERNHQGFEYEFKGKKHKYYPDFILEDRTYVEIKGWMTEQNKMKISSFKDRLLILGKKEIQPFIKYAMEKHGKDFINLYTDQ